MAISSTIASSAFLIELETDRVDGDRRAHRASMVSMTILPCWSRQTDARGGTSVVASYSSIRSGPERALGPRSARPTTGDLELADVAAEERPAAAARADRRRHAARRPCLAVADARGQAEIDQRDRIGHRRVAVGPVVLARERLDERLRPGGRVSRGRQRDRQLVRLARVAEVHEPGELEATAGGRATEHAPRVLLHRRERVIDRADDRRSRGGA